MAAKRARKQNFSSCERITLIEEFSARKDILLQKFKSSQTNQQKQVAWAEVTAAINAVSPVERSVAEVKEKWSKLSSEARTHLRARKFLQTGSGKAIEMPDMELLEKIFENYDLMEGNSTDVGGLDSGEASQVHYRSRSPAQSDISDTELKELDKEKKLLEVQCARNALELKEMEKEKLLTEMRQAAEIHELEKDKRKLEIQLLKNKVLDVNK